MYHYVVFLMKFTRSAITHAITPALFVKNRFFELPCIIDFQRVRF
jgi:hypothetical protein